MFLRTCLELQIVFCGPPNIYLQCSREQYLGTNCNCMAGKYPLDWLAIANGQQVTRPWKRPVPCCPPCHLIFKTMQRGYVIHLEWNSVNAISWLAVFPGIICLRWDCLNLPMPLQYIRLMKGIGSCCHPHSRHLVPERQQPKSAWQSSLAANLWTVKLLRQLSVRMFDGTTSLIPRYTAYTSFGSPSGPTRKRFLVRNSTWNFLASKHYGTLFLRQPIEETMLAVRAWLGRGSTGSTGSTASLPSACNNFDQGDLLRSFIGILKDKVFAGQVLGCERAIANGAKVYFDKLIWRCTL